MSIEGDIAGAVSALSGLGSAYFAWRTVSRAKSAAKEQAEFTKKMAELQIEAQRHASQEATAYDFYRDYLDRAMNNPTLYDPALATNIQKNSAEWKRCYFAFVSSLLFSCEEMLRVSLNNEDWQAVVKVQLRNHKRYLKERVSQVHFGSLYTVELMNCIQSICDELEIGPETPSAGWLADRFITSPDVEPDNA